MHSEKKGKIFSEKSSVQDEYDCKEKRTKRSLKHQGQHFPEEMKFIRQLDEKNFGKRQKSANFFWCVWEHFLSAKKDGSI